MIIPKSNRIPASTGLRVLADLVDAAKANGAKRDPRVSISSQGVYSITLIYNGEAPLTDIAAWQLATGVWEIHSRTFPDVNGVMLRSRTAQVVYQDVVVELCIITPGDVVVAA